jgi:hypothetical protein
MAAIAYDRLDRGTGWQRPPGPVPALRLVEGAAARRPSATVLRRRRIVALVLVALAVVAVGRLLDASLGATATAAPVDRVPLTVVAQPGDTYWSLAARLDVGGDVRSTVDSLVRANGGHDLRAGDRIHLGS